MRSTEVKGAKMENGQAAPTISATTDSVTAVFHAVMGGAFRVRLQKESSKEPGRRHVDVLDDAGNVIGGGYDYIYGGAGFAIHTKPFGGYVPEGQLVWVE